MPYRRLPKTDQARLKSLQKAIDLEKLELDKIPISLKLLSQAKAYYNAFNMLVGEYNQTFDTQVESNKKYQGAAKNVKMYISHFIQVLNFAVIRGDLKKNVKEYYKLNPDDNTVTDLTSDAALIEWGKNIIDGEQERVAHGGVPLSFPSAAKLKVFYDIFYDLNVSQKIRQKSTSRNQQKVAEMRDQVDELILQIWDSIEAYYEHLLPYEKLITCQKCGIIYYYRNKEEQLTPETDKEILLKQAAQQKIEFDD